MNPKSPSNKKTKLTRISTIEQEDYQNMLKYCQNPVNYQKINFKSDIKENHTENHWWTYIFLQNNFVITLIVEIRRNHPYSRRLLHLPKTDANWMKKISKKMFQLYFKVLNLIWYKVMHCQFHIPSFFFVIAKFSPKIMKMHWMKLFHHSLVRFANQCLPKCFHQSSMVLTYFEWTLELRSLDRSAFFCIQTQKRWSWSILETKYCIFRK